jgi:hypothetical protein
MKKNKKYKQQQQKVNKIMNYELRNERKAVVVAAAAEVKEKGERVYLNLKFSLMFVFTFSHILFIREKKTLTTTPSSKKMIFVHI